MRIAGEERWIAVEDAARYRDAVGASPPAGVAETFLEPTDAPLDLLLARWARTHAPFVADAPAARWGSGRATVEDRLRAMAAEGSLLEGAFRPGGAAHEFTDPDVLRQLRRRSLARLRREVEPVEPTVLARFLPAWHGVGSSAGGLGRLLEVVAQLEGVPIPASVLERDVLPARVAGYTPRLLDELGAAGEVVWIGRGTLGRDDGRIALYRRDRVDLLASAGTSDDRPSEPVHEAIRTHLQRRGASFYPQLRAAIGEAGSEAELLDARLGSRLGGRGHERHVRRASGARAAAIAVEGAAASRTSDGARPATRRRPMVAGGRPRRRGSARRPNAGMRSPPRSSSGTASSPARRWPRRAIAGGYAAVYPVLKAMEESGRARRGYFVAGLGAAQFALPGAVDRLRAAATTRTPWSVRVLAATDPAQPYGAALAWPRSADDERLPLQRAAGAYVVLVDGEAVLYLERGGRGLLRLPAAADADRARRAVAALPCLVTSGGPMRELRIERVDRAPVAESSLADALREAGFHTSYRGYVLRRA